MSETEERAAAEKGLGERLGFRLIDDSDWFFDHNGKRVSAHNAYWFVLSGHDDARLDQPIRHGQWPEAAEIAIRQLWHRCVALSAEKASENAKNAKYRSKLSVIACGIMAGSLAIPLVLRVLHVINLYQFNFLWRHSTYLAVAALGSLIAVWWMRF